MISIRVPKNWTPPEANAAITLIETILDALWRQYPAAHEEHFYEPLDCDGYPLQDPPDLVLDSTTTEDEDEQTEDTISSDEIPF